MLKCYSPTEEIFGKRYEEWIAYFWNNFGTKRFWLRGPVFICPGKVPEAEIARTINKQYGFATRQEQESPDIKRYKIDSDKAILLSPMCFFQALPNEKPYDKDDLSRVVEKRMTEVGPINIAFDGVEIKDKLVRVRTDVFELDGKYDAVSDGYWLFIKPGELDDGKHTINTYATCLKGIVKVKNDFILDIQETGSKGADWLFTRPQVREREPL